MSDFKAKMHQIRFRLGLLPRPHSGSLHRSPRPLAGFKGPTSNRKGGKEKGEGRKGRGGGRERRGICLLLNLGLATPLQTNDKIRHMLLSDLYRLIKSVM